MLRRAATGLPATPLFVRKTPMRFSSISSLRTWTPSQYPSRQKTKVCHGSHLRRETTLHFQKRNTEHHQSPKFAPRRECRFLRRLLCGPCSQSALTNSTCSLAFSLAVVSVLKRLPFMPTNLSLPVVAIGRRASAHSVSLSRKQPTAWA